MAKKRFGQHFLTDRNIIAAIIAAIDPQPDDSIIEIGAGRGALTDHLVASGAAITAIELDRDLLPALHQRYQRDEERVQMVGGDALALHLPDLHPAPPVRIVGNLPYNISTPLLLRFARYATAPAGWLRDVVVMLQREVGQRLTAATGSSDYGRLSVHLQRVFSVAHIVDALPAAFRPPPAVESVVLRLTPHPADDITAPPPRFDTVVRTAFQYRRKTLARALAELAVDWDACPIDPTLRAQNLTHQDFATLARHIPS